MGIRRQVLLLSRPSVRWLATIVLLLRMIMMPPRSVKIPHPKLSGWTIKTKSRKRLAKPKRNVTKRTSMETLYGNRVPSSATSVINSKNYLQRRRNRMRAMAVAITITIMFSVRIRQNFCIKTKKEKIVRGSKKWETSVTFLGETKNYPNSVRKRVVFAKVNYIYKATINLHKIIIE